MLGRRMSSYAANDADLRSAFSRFSSSAFALVQGADDWPGSSAKQIWCLGRKIYIHNQV